MFHRFGNLFMRVVKLIVNVLPIIVLITLLTFTFLLNFINIDILIDSKHA